MNNFYIVATPIGNVSEISLRSLECFKKTNIIFCEDTRIIKKLLNKLNISILNKKFIKCNEFSEQKIGDIALNFLKKEDCLLVSDAGYPLINDPGYLIKNFLYSHKINPIVINGPCSIIHSLVICNFPINNFYFHGFLNKKKNKKIKELQEIKKINSTIVIFESVHNLLETLLEIKNNIGDIYINICKELTKLNEKIYYGKISELINQINLQGEFIIIFKNILNDKLNEEELIYEIDNLIKKNTKIKEACKMVSYKYNIRSNYLFNLYKLKKGF